jgi:glycolate oxidase FAD binding subunit
MDTESGAADCSEELLAQVCTALATGTPLLIQGGGTKAFHGRHCNGALLDTRCHRGIVSHEPTELVVTVRAGTPVAELEAVLHGSGQMLAFEPAQFGGQATVGGMVAAGLSGPRRPWAGAVRDFVLGCRVITGHGKHLRFGGEVMKNVAGYDVSRLMAGSLGCLGLLTEVSLKVLPRPRSSCTLCLDMDVPTALQRFAEWGQRPWPITAACHDGEALMLRLEGGEGSVKAAREALGGEQASPAFWAALREFRLDFFADPAPLWRMSVANDSRPVMPAGPRLVDWGGAQWWIKSNADSAEIRRAAAAAGGHASCFTPGACDSPLHPLPAALMRYHRQLKAQLDPQGIFNPGRMYAEL